MLKRKMYSKLLEWKKSEKKECLLVKGARQVGKTYLIRAFGKQEYESFIEINFYRQPELKGIFDGERSAEELYKKITAMIPNVRLIEGKTLIFLDEIQKCANARTALKFLVEDGRYDIIASGSLLGLSYGQDDDREVEEVESIPVGYEKQVMMYSLDFEEFLWAYGYGDDTISYLREYYDKCENVPGHILEKFENLVKEYLVVGGMPEVVDDFIARKDFGRVQEIQEKILNAYADDVAHHAKGAEKVKVRKCYDSIPAQLAKENTKFKYSEVEHKATSRKYADSIQWLRDANMILVCNNVSTPQLPLSVYEKDNEFKVYMNDTGLLMARYGFATKRALLNGSLKGFAKCGIFENFIAETLVKNGYKINYYRPNDSMELEFVIEKGAEVVPIEVKAGNTATKSLNRFVDEFGSSLAYKVINGNVGVSEKKVTIPHFMAMFV